MDKITKLSNRFKELSLHKMLKHYNFLLSKSELSDEEKWGKERLKKYIEISLRDNGEWAKLILFTDDKELIALCQGNIKPQEIFDEIINQPITKRLANDFSNHLYNFN